MTTKDRTLVAICIGQNLKDIHKAANESPKDLKGLSYNSPSCNQLKLVWIIKPFGVNHVSAAFPWLQINRSNSNQKYKQKEKKNK